MKTFAELFKKYRLRAEFGTLAEFGSALADKGILCEDSIFSHWQKGSRVPTNRKLVLTLIEIFIENGAIKTVDEADEFLSVTGLGFLTEQEKKTFIFQQESYSPFQVPSEIAHFTGREDIVKKVKKEILNGNVILLYGPPGVGKTALAIKLGCLLQNEFPDGVLWYKVDSSNIMDILLSIAPLFGEDIKEIKDIEVRASIVRTLLSKKRILLIFDNVTKHDKLHLLVPNASSCSAIFSSQENVLPISTKYVSISVNVFTKGEVLALFKKVFDKKYVTKNKSSILKISEKVGDLPLAVNIAATHIRKFSLSPNNYLKQLNEESLNLRILKYEDKSLLQAVAIGFSSLDRQTQVLFSTLGVFEGKDFSLDAVSFINKLSLRDAEKILQQLLDISFIENSKIKRYRIHPTMRAFAREKIDDTSIYLRAATYYEQLLVSSQDKSSSKSLIQETDNIVYIYKKCYDLGYWDQIITLWNPIEKFLSDNNEIKKLRLLTKTINTTPTINKFQNGITVFYIILVLYWVILFFTDAKTSFWNNFYSLSYTFMPLFSGCVGFICSKPWGLFSTNIGKAIFFIASGLFFWGIGNIIWAYYNFFQNIAAPYPSLADVSFAPAYILWTIGIVYLSKATGAKFSFQAKHSKFFLLLIPFTVTTIAYYLLLFLIKRTFDTEAPIKIFFDLYYPSMDIIILTLAIIIFGFSVNFLGGKYKLSLFAILGGFAFLYFADFMFSYATSINTYYNGNLADLFFATAFYLLTWGTLSFYLTPKKHLKNF